MQNTRKSHTAVLPPKTNKNHTITTKHPPHILIKKVLTNSTTIAKPVPLNSISTTHRVVKVKPKKKVTRLKHKQLKHQPLGNVTTHSSTQPATIVHDQIKTLPVAAATNATKLMATKGPKKYKLVKVIKRKRKEKQPIAVAIVTTPPTTQSPIIASNKSTIVTTATPAAIYDSTTTIATTTTTTHMNLNIFKKLPEKRMSLNETIRLIYTTALPGLNQTALKVGDTPLSEAITMAAAGAAAGAAAAAVAAMSKDGKSSSKSLTDITRDALFKKLISGNGILSENNRLNITAAAAAATNTTIPPINREILGCVTKERLAESGLNMDLQKEIESYRVDLMFQRQRSAARQMRLASQVSGNLMRENYNSELSDRLVESELKRQGETRRQSKFREELRNRFNQLRMTFSDWT